MSINITWRRCLCMRLYMCFASTWCVFCFFVLSLSLSEQHWIQQSASHFIIRSLKSCRIQHIKALAKTQWKKRWDENTQSAKQLRRILITDEIKRGSKLYNNIANRNICAKLVQLRTGHCALNSYLHRFGKRNSPTCECGYGKETVEHYLLECRKYKEQRRIAAKERWYGENESQNIIGKCKDAKAHRWIYYHNGKIRLGLEDAPLREGTHEAPFARLSACSFPVILLRG